MSTPAQGDSGGAAVTAWADRAWSGLPEALAGSTVVDAGHDLARLAASRLAECRHGDLPGWLRALEQLPPAPEHYHPERAAPELGGPVSKPAAMIRQLMALHPWRKGPLKLGGVDIDTEWRSDWKWARVAPHIDLEGATVLDVGCGNGYFGWRMLAAGAKAVVGLDPTLVFVMQWLAQRHFAPKAANFVLPLADTDLPDTARGFDAVFTMGVIYHRREPLDHLTRMRDCLAPGGQLVLETLVLDQDGRDCLVPEGRYARMRNVFYLPTPARLLSDLERVGLRNAQVVDVTRTTTQEQRTTPWMRFESLDRCLDPHNPGLTIEGLPAPVRAVVVARA